ncbi:hypothetical protein [Phytohabitans rumicis]|uniref:Secreted protein n=1 Tax=Phytohabitans rumicis TaxID=1076125 RepID=A0A6V8LNC4_9ACTN|nr:hypothetical protein [Phytohabitans rumicis]GFJ95577.1 hypothetical protein Prum_092190 [Phytohabitans rumicis]
MRASTLILPALVAAVALAGPASAGNAPVSPGGADTTTSTDAGTTISTYADLIRAGVDPNLQSVTCSTQSFPVHCFVIEPTVTQEATTYPAIQFQPGQRVVIEAGGCVQTGGRGLTWKRYVNPSPNNGLYHGTIAIPGATNGLVVIQNVINRPLLVGANGGALQLGYQDDGYSDNGYSAHDNGTGDQCKNVENAWVHITIS